MPKGQKQFNRNLEAAIAKQVRAAQAGVSVAAQLVKAESQKRTPVDEGILKASHYTDVQVQTSKKKVVAEVGLTAKYAVWVHEAVGMKLKGQKRPKNKKRKKGDRGRFWDVQGQATAKFLEKAVDENKDKIRKIIAKYTKVK